MSPQRTSRMQGWFRTLIIILLLGLLIPSGAVFAQDQTPPTPTDDPRTLVEEPYWLQPNDGLHVENLKGKGNPSAIPPIDSASNLQAETGNEVTGLGSLVNGNFELGRNVGWSEYSSHHFPVVINHPPSTGVLPHSGAWLAWLGGANSETSRISQSNITIPYRAALQLWYWSGSGDYCGYDFATLKFNGNLLHSWDLCYNTNTYGWAVLTIESNLFYGQSGTLTIELTTDSSNSSSLLIDDVAILGPYTISGNAGVAGATLSYMDGPAGYNTVTSDGSGNYSIVVPYNWSGTVTPSKFAYTFSPVSRSYSNLSANLGYQNYAATLIRYTISGSVGVAGVTLSYTDGTAKSVTSAYDGSYSFTVPYTWSGTVTPSHPCYTFNPVNRPYNYVLANQTGQDYTATINPAAGCKDVNVAIGGASQGTYSVPLQGSLRLTYPSLDNGPAKVSTGSDPIIASERINLKTNTMFNSYAEVMGLPASKLSDTFIFPWYNNTGFLDSQLRFGNVGTQSTTITIKIGGVARPETFNLGPNESARVSFPGVDAGPVEIKSSNGEPIIAALRINLKVNSPYTSYSEFLGLSASDTASTRYIFPWYNNLGLLDSQLRFANVGDAQTTVSIKIGGVVQAQTYTLDPNQSVRISFALDNGPVEVTSSGGVPITAAMRINLKNNPTYTSYTELMGLTGATLTDTRYIFPWYNNTGLLDSQLRFANVGNAQTTVTIKVHGVDQPQTYTLAPNESTRVSLAGIDNGPIEVYSSGNVPIIAALRINIKKNTAYDSYYEFMGMSVGTPLGLPGDQLSTTYWFPWYNNTGLLDSQLRFGLP